MLLPGVMGGVGFPGKGELGYPGIDRPGCGGTGTVSERRGPGTDGTGHRPGTRPRRKDSPR